MEIKFDMGKCPLNFFKTFKEVKGHETIKTLYFYISITISSEEDFTEPNNNGDLDRKTFLPIN